MKTVFMGTPDFAVPALNALIDSKYNVELVFTRPDKPKNRGQKLHKTPVKECAEKYGIKVFQPVSLKKGDDAAKSLELLKSINPDFIIVAAYGMLLPKEILDLPKYGCINIHASLLPRYRGAAPINHCIMNGDTESGISIMHMSEGMDEGDVIISESIEITVDTNASLLHDKLMNLGAGLMLKALKMIENGTAPRIAQDNQKACLAPMLTKEMCKIDWSQPAINIFNQIRGLAETPCAYTFLGEKRLKIYKAELIEKDFPKVSQKGVVKPGEITNTSDFTVLCGDGDELRITELQLEGGKKMDTKTFLLGRKLEAGCLL